MWMIASGKTVRQIADELFLSPNTVSTHRTRILRKMNMKSKCGADALRHRSPFGRLRSAGLLQKKRNGSDLDLEGLGVVKTTTAGWSVFRYLLSILPR